MAFLVLAVDVVWAYVSLVELHPGLDLVCYPCGFTFLYGYRAVMSGRLHDVRDQLSYLFVLC